MSDLRRSRTPTCVLAAVLMALSYAPAAVANEVCRGIPTALDEQAARDAFGAADAAAFVDSRPSLEVALDAVCADSKESARLFKKRAKRIVLQMAADATEPSPYIDGDDLIVEFYGGAFDTAQFRRAVEDALRGKVSDSND